MLRLRRHRAFDHFVQLTAVQPNAAAFLRPSGSPGDWDILGCQQYGPLLDLEIP